MANFEMTHTTVKNDAKAVTHYLIKADGTTVGSATKGEKGKFNFTPREGAGKALTDIATMRDLKAEVAKGVTKKWLDAQPAEPSTKAPGKGGKATPEPEPTPAEAQANVAEGGEDIDLT